MHGMGPIEIVSETLIYDKLEIRQISERVHIDGIKVNRTLGL